ncbi:MAG TPA: antitoxin MazE-like protein [Pontimonas sp.]|nr:antitoxin MazE-like protein [Pontimonas sp.]
MVKDRNDGKPVRARVSRHRSKLRDAGLKPVQLWVPDTANTDVRSRLQDLSYQVENYPGADDDRAFLYALTQDPE